jgi:hypothetical protein
MTYDPNARSKALTQAGLPAKTGLYDPANEHDACGIGMIANIHNDKSHRIIADGLRILENLEHRGAVGADPKAGDGAGILIQIPHDFFAGEAKRLGFELPAAGDYGVGFVFMPRDPAVRERIEQIFDKAAAEENLEVLGWRDVPVNSRPFWVNRSSRPSRSIARSSWPVAPTSRTPTRKALPANCSSCARSCPTASPPSATPIARATTSCRCHRTPSSTRASCWA